MAHTATGTITHGVSTKAIFGSIADFFVRVAESNHRVKSLQNLSSMSDEQLAERGLKRDEIVRHDIRDVYYL
jgi:uncharacterized protein YjiS (DUF1127 family)